MCSPSLPPPPCYTEASNKSGSGTKKSDQKLIHGCICGAIRELGSEKTAKVACLKSSPVDFKLKVKVAQSVSNSFWPHGLYTPWNSPGQNTKVGSLSPLQVTFLTQESYTGLPHFRQILYQLIYQGSLNFWIGSPLMFFVRHKWGFKLTFITSGWSNSLNVTVLRLATWSLWIHSGYKINIYEGLGQDEEKEWKGKVKKSKSGSSIWAVAEVKRQRMVSFDSASWFMAQARHRDRDGGVTSQQA